MRAVLVLIALAAGCNNDDQNFTEIQPLLEVAPMVSDLGTVALGGRATASLAISHVGGTRATIAEVTVDGPADAGFVVTDYPGTLEVDEAGSLLVSYTPAAVGWHQATLTITYDNAEEPTIEVVLRGHAIVGSAALRPGVLDFGDVPEGEIATRTLVVDNTGAADLSIVEATSVDAFELGVPLPVVVPAGQTLDLPVTFLSAGPAVVNETLVLSLDASIDLPPVVLRANDCRNGDPDVYDADDDGVTTCAGDCDDSDPGVRPGANEIEDGVDQDCDEIVDDGTLAGDDDGDGFSENDGDCDDSNANTWPGTLEDASNGVDDDCDGTVDAGTFDNDGDGFGAAGGDCDDTDAGVHPGAEEIVDGVDQDCDADIDEGTDSYDDDGDGFDEVAGDCDDTDLSVNPDEAESANWRDDDCDGSVDEGTVNVDDDGDGYSEIGGDCDDADSALGPASIEVTGNAVDEDCDGVVG